MNYRITVISPHSTTLNEFATYEEALHFYSNKITWLHIYADKVTNVIFEKMQMGEWLAITDRFDSIALKPLK